MKEITCVVQARITGNMRVPRKMVRPFAGTCLFRILLEKLDRCKNLNRDQIYISVCEKELIDIAKEFNFQIYERPMNSVVEDEVVKPSMRDVYSWAFDLNSDHFMQINACNPMLSIESIDRAIETYQNNDYNSLFSVVERKNFYFNPESEVISKFVGIPEHEVYFKHLGTQWVEPVYEAAHSIYIFNREFFMNNDMLRWSLSKNDPYLFELPPEEAFDVDYPWQFDLAEKMYLQSLSPVQKKSDGLELRV